MKFYIWRHTIPFACLGELNENILILTLAVRHYTPIGQQTNVAWCDLEVH